MRRPLDAANQLLDGTPAAPATSTFVDIEPRTLRTLRCACVLAWIVERFLVYAIKNVSLFALEMIHSAA